MKHVYIVDSIGIHCGMNYYADSFKSVIGEKGFSSTVLSNYSENNHNPLFYNFYKGNFVVKILKLFISCLRLFYKVLRDRESVYIIFSYGTIIDFFLLLITLCAKNRMIDVHEVIQQGSERKIMFRHIYSFIYRHMGIAIIHSKRSDFFLSEIGFKGRVIFVPHFEYQVSSKYNEEQINPDVRNLISNKINILWFGNITFSKGIDLFIDNINSLPVNVKNKINIIIAGRSLDGTFEKCNVSDSVFSITLKYINDDEMTYLYTQTDYVVLPYRQTSQSGVLEMAFHYQKPVIVSNIPYFSMMLNKYPSFGVVTEIHKEVFCKTIESLTQYEQQFYTEKDVFNYCHREEIREFANEFEEVILKL